MIAWQLGRCRSGADLEALTSDVFFILWKSRKRLREQTVAGYLAVVARRRAFRFLRKKRVEIPTDPEEMPELPAKSFADESEKRLLAEALLDMLDGQSKALFIRHYYFGQTVEDAAKELDMNPSTAKARLARGREKLARMLKEEE